MTVTARDFRILLLGEGNFSFTLALCRLLFDVNDNVGKDTAAHQYLCLPPDFDTQRISITATSIDSRSEVIEKYPESASIFKQICGYNRDDSVAVVELRHEVNACELQNHFAKGSFDVIIWNHPHINVEDFRLHRFLLAHFLSSAKHVLKSTSSPSLSYAPNICISLVEGQEIRWGLYDEARFVGFKSESVVPLMEFPGYVCKRNRNGQSFKNIHTLKHCRSEMKSFLHRFCVDPLGPVPRSSSCATQHDSTGDMVEQMQSMKIADKKPSAITLSSEIVLFDPFIHTFLNEKKKSKNTTKDHMVVSPEVIYRCPECQRTFTSLRAIRQHYHGAHELKIYEIIDEKRHECQDCGKKFAKLCDFEQHVTSKHSSIYEEERTFIEENNIVHNIDLSIHNNKVQYYPCAVCGQSVTRSEQFDGMSLHLESLKPLLGRLMSCPLKCDSGKTFLENRALEQHYRFCRKKISS